MKKLNYTIEGKHKSDDQSFLEKEIELRQTIIDKHKTEITSLTNRIKDLYDRIRIEDKILYELRKKITPSK